RHDVALVVSRRAQTSDDLGGAVGFQSTPRVSERAPSCRAQAFQRRLALTGKRAKRQFERFLAVLLQREEDLPFAAVGIAEAADDGLDPDAGGLEAVQPSSRLKCIEPAESRDLMNQDQAEGSMLRVGDHLLEARTRRVLGPADAVVGV